MRFNHPSIQGSQSQISDSSFQFDLGNHPDFNNQCTDDIQSQSVIQREEDFSIDLESHNDYFSDQIYHSQEQLANQDDMYSIQLLLAQSKQILQQSSMNYHDSTKQNKTVINLQLSTKYNSLAESIITEQSFQWKKSYSLLNHSYEQLINHLNRSCSQLQSKPILQTLNEKEEIHKSKINQLNKSKIKFQNKDINLYLDIENSKSIIINSFHNQNDLTYLSQSSLPENPSSASNSRVLKNSQSSSNQLDLPSNSEFQGNQNLSDLSHTKYHKSVINTLNKDEHESIEKIETMTQKIDNLSQIQQKQLNSIQSQNSSPFIQLAFHQLNFPRKYSFEQFNQSTTQNIKKISDHQKSDNPLLQKDFQQYMSTWKQKCLQLIQTNKYNIKQFKVDRILCRQANGFASINIYKKSSYVKKFLELLSYDDLSKICQNVEVSINFAISDMRFCKECLEILKKNKFPIQSLSLSKMNNNRIKTFCNFLNQYPLIAFQIQRLTLAGHTFRKSAINYLEAIQFSQLKSVWFNFTHFKGHTKNILFLKNHFFGSFDSVILYLNYIELNTCLKLAESSPPKIKISYRYFKRLIESFNLQYNDTQQEKIFFNVEKIEKCLKIWPKMKRFFEFIEIEGYIQDKTKQNQQTLIKASSKLQNQMKKENDLRMTDTTNKQESILSQQHEQQ